MYFVVYLVEPEKYAVIPTSWIYDPRNEIWNKFVNTGLNSSQMYLCYWASDENSAEYIGAPQLNVEPNFMAPPTTIFPCRDGTYRCRIVKFNVDFMMACNYRDLKITRNLQPVIYYQRRISQRPIPVIRAQREVGVDNCDEIACSEQQDNGATIDVDGAVVASENNAANPGMIEAGAVGLVPEINEIACRKQQENVVIVGVDGTVPVGENVAADPEMMEADAGAVGLGNEMVEFLDENVAEVEIDGNEVAAIVNEVAAIGELVEGIAIVNGPDAINEIPISIEGFGGANVKEEVVISHAALDEMNDILLHAYDEEFDENVCAPEESTQAHFSNANVPPTADDEHDIGLRSGYDEIPTNVQHVYASEYASSATGSNPNDLHENEHIDVFYDSNEEEVIDDETDPNGNGNDGEIPTTVQNVSASAISLNSLAAIERDLIAGESDIEASANDLNDSSTECASIANSSVSTAPLERENIDVFYDSDEDEIVMSYKGEKFPVPQQSHPVPNTFVKHENDRLCGDKPYEDVEGARKFLIGNDIVMIPKETIDALLLWSTHPYSVRRDFDQKFVWLLLLSCVDEADMKIGLLKDEVITFIEDLFRIRVKSDERRFDAFGKYKNEMLKKKGATQQKK